MGLSIKYKKKLRKSASNLTLALFVTLASVGFVFIQFNDFARAINNFDNKKIATVALSKTGYGGPCKVFVNNVVNEASGGKVSVAGGYHSAFSKAGGIEVSSTSATIGDIIQVGNSDFDYPLHTAIILTNKGGGNFSVRDSNWVKTNTIGTHDFSPWVWAKDSGNQNADIRIWRLGTVSSPSDFDQDGTADIAWHQASTLFFLKGNGSGFYQAGKNPATAPVGTPDWSGSADVNNDGKSEVLWYHSYNQTLYTLFWTGSTWQTKFTTPGLGKPDAAVVGDFDQDGTADIAWHQASTLFFLKGNGSGFYQAGKNPATAPVGTPDWSGSADVNNDGKSEVLWYHSYNQTLYTLFWTGSTWQTKFTTPGLGKPDAAVVGDFDQDGTADIAWHQASTLFFLKGNGSGFYQAGKNPATAPVGTPDWSGSADVNNDGKSEVLWYHSYNQTLYTLFWTGSTWQTKFTTPGLGKPDAAVAN